PLDRGRSGPACPPRRRRDYPKAVAPGREGTRARSCRALGRARLPAAVRPEPLLGRPADGDFDRLVEGPRVRDGIAVGGWRHQRKELDDVTARPLPADEAGDDGGAGPERDEG